MLHEQGEKEGKKKIDGTGTDREREEAGRGEKDERTSPVRGAVERETSNGDMCLRHNEQLRMFCDRDKERICVTCWELEHHDHMIKTLSHADKELKREVTAAMGLLQRAIGEVEELRKKQETITSSNRLRNLLVKSHITSQFKEIREQLSVLEERAVRQTEELNENDDRRLAEFEEVLQGSRKKEAQLKAGVEMDDFGGFLRWWTETGQAESETQCRLKEKYPELSTQLRSFQSSAQAHSGNQASGFGSTQYQLGNQASGFGSAQYQLGNQASVFGLPLVQPVEQALGFSYRQMGGYSFKTASQRHTGISTKQAEKQPVSLLEFINLKGIENCILNIAGSQQPEGSRFGNTTGSLTSGGGRF